MNFQINLFSWNKIKLIKKNFGHIEDNWYKGLDDISEKLEIFRNSKINLNSDSLSVIDSFS